MAGLAHTEDPPWPRASAPEHRREMPPPTAERTARKEGRADLVGVPLTGDLFSDGSVEDPGLVSARAGWAVAAMGHDEEAVSLFGPRPRPFPQESGAAELYAAIEANQGSLPPMRLFTDCQLLAGGFAAG